MLKINNLTKRLGRRNIIENLSLELEDGIYGLLGPNGAGKTTFMRCIMGAYLTKKDVITLDGMQVGSKEYFNKTGYLPQSFGLFKEMKVYDMLMYMAGMKINKESDAKKEVEALLEKVNLTDKKTSKVKTLSGGMLRRLGVAQALLNNPKMIIFDEPTAGLDPEERIRFKKILSGLSKDKIIIISTHIVSDVENICDGVIVMNNGQIKYQGDVQTIEKMGENYGDDSESLLERGYLCVIGD